jgi:uncharacterized protein YlzI (FlbEa/FlbD family)
VLLELHTNKNGSGIKELFLNPSEIESIEEISGVHTHSSVTLKSGVKFSCVETALEIAEAVKNISGKG